MQSPDAAAAARGSVGRADLVNFVDRQALEACIVRDCRRPGIHYVSFVDTNGSGSDAMSLATAHHDRTYAHGMREAPPPFSPATATAEFADTLKQYRCDQIIVDRYGGEWPRSAVTVQAR